MLPSLGPKPKEACHTIAALSSTTFLDHLPARLSSSLALSKILLLDLSAHSFALLVYRLQQTDVRVPRAVWR